MALLNTTIILRNDSTANWLANENVILARGEVAIEFLANGKAKMKIGDGEKTWAQLSYFGGESAKYYDVVPEVAENGSVEIHLDAITRVVNGATLSAGDIAVVKETFAPGKTQYTAYVYDGDAATWKAMDGNYSADNVYTAKDLTLAGNFTTIGNYEKGDVIAAGTLISGITSNSTSTADKTVTAHTQANGVVTLTYSDIAIKEGQVAGLTDKLTTMQGEIDAEETRAAAAENGLKGRLDTVQGTDTDKSMREVAQEVSTSGLTGLTNANIQTLGQDETALVVGQNNGAVTVTKQKIQIAESQVTGLTAALALKATEADLTAAENRIKANEDAITKLNGADTVVDSVANKIKTAIEGLDKTDTAVEGQFVTSVSEENGVITVARGAVNVKDLEQTADTYVVFDCGSSSINI